MNYSEFYELKKIYSQLDNACKKANIQNCIKAKKRLAEFIGNIDSDYYMANGYKNKRVKAIIRPVLMYDVYQKINDDLAIYAVKRERPLNLHDTKLIKDAAISLSLKISK